MFAKVSNKFWNATKKRYICGVNRTKHIATLWAAAIILTAGAVVGLWLWLRPAPANSPMVDKFPIKGIDLSAHNGEIDFNKVRDAGYEFVYLKATEGVDFKDARFERNTVSARRAGLKVGAYHFFRFDTPAYMQALNLAQSVRMQPLDLPLVIDIEQWTNPSGHSADSVLRHAAQMAHTLEKQGYKVMFYTNKQGQARWVRRELRNYPLWICSLSDLSNPEDYAVWQYNHSGSVAGINGHVDMNVFCGTKSDWKDWLLQNKKQQ